MHTEYKDDILSDKQKHPLSFFSGTKAKQFQTTRIDCVQHLFHTVAGLFLSLLLEVSTTCNMCLREKDAESYVLANEAVTTFHTGSLT